MSSNVDDDREQIRSIFEPFVGCSYLAEFWPTNAELEELGLPGMDFWNRYIDRDTKEEIAEEIFRSILLRFWNDYPAARRGRVLPSTRRN